MLLFDRKGLPYFTKAILVRQPDIDSCRRRESLSAVDESDVKYMSMRRESYQEIDHEYERDNEEANLCKRLQFL